MIPKVDAADVECALSQLEPREIQLFIDVAYMQLQYYDLRDRGMVVLPEDTADPTSLQMIIDAAKCIGYEPDDTQWEQIAHCLDNGAYLCNDPGASMGIDAKQSVGRYSRFK